MTPRDIIAGADYGEVVKRRFGPSHPKPCHNRYVVTCAYWECQWANECQGLNSPEKPSPDVATFRALRKETGGE